MRRGNKSKGKPAWLGRPKKRRDQNRFGRALPVAGAAERLLAALGAKDELTYLRLWKAWPEVLGQELAQMARPLGRRGSLLVLGIEDSIVAQELAYFQPEILKRVNGFLGRKAFDKVTYELLRGRVPLDLERPMGHPKAACEVRRPSRLGGLAGRAHGDDAAARAYRAYLRLMAGHKKT